MKIGQLLNEMVDEAIANQTLLVYHGSPTKIESFSDEFVGGENAVDQEGPGIYFTTLFDDAAGYAEGGYVYSARISPRLLYDESEDKAVPEDLLLKLVMMAPDWEDNAYNFSENPQKGANMAVSNSYEYNDNEKDVLLQIWIEFYRYSSVDFVRNCVKLGIDGIIVNRPTAKHVIVYNPSIIEVTDIKKMS
jgi:hypothetical protein